MTSSRSDIRKTRPRLKEVAPLSAAIVLGYGIVNILLGIGMWIYVNPSPHATIATINDFFTFQVWGTIFASLGMFKLWALHKNDWVAIRASLLTGIAIKTIWAFALFFRFLDGGSVLLFVIWLFFAYIQTITYIYFIPTVKQKLI